MKPVYQEVVDEHKGDCMQAVIASLLELPLSEVPDFINQEQWFGSLYNFLAKNGHGYYGMIHNKKYQTILTPKDACFKKVKWHNRSVITKRKLYDENGVNGFFFASVLSPKFVDLTSKKITTHAVVIDRDYNIVHDPNPEYKNILQHPLANVIGYNGIIDVFLIE